MAWHDDLSVQVLSACNRRVEVVELKPQEHAVSVWCDGGISDVAMMMLHIPPVQLKDQPAMGNEPLVLGPAVGAFAAQETSIPATARLDIGYANKWLWMHTTLCIEDRLIQLNLAVRLRRKILVEQPRLSAGPGHTVAMGGGGFSLGPGNSLRRGKYARAARQD
jgi:hypothetical protein